ncbi:ACS family hexuronate transporter-like MFS transporter [Alteromonas sp. 38]|uniref:MFS transporter n=1 Tax=Alteromonas TaxID=226 RepID=UPI0012F3EB51|nr:MULTISPECIES: MFS transporter [unclassified Alteromonas]CAD5260388.1 ACS family hexuronate transporter-like MFS transporter [Alteromonas sp. 154]VXC32340.1 ACS family hexuronate transporter-like MFS transporter [Alteromonas sp. 38]
MKLNGLRWWVIALIALATVINYIDRQALSVLWPDIVEELFPDESALERKQIYANISIVFVFAYAFGQAIFGKIFDWVGTRLGFVLSIGVWSLATIAHAFAQGVLTFSLFRAILGIAEAGNWPGAAKGNAEWFPTKERALAQGLFNSGAAIGGIIAIPLIAFLTVYFSWQMLFVVVGAVGLLWLIPWLILVKAPPGAHPWITDEEREYILTGQRQTTMSADMVETDVEEYNPSTGELLKRKQSWGVILASAAIDPIWWLFVFWIPIYLNEVYAMDVKSIGIYGWVPYVGAMFGAWFGGLLAQNRLKAGWNTDKTRKLTITLGCLIMLPSLLAMSQPGSPTMAVIIMAVILFGFQTAIGNVQTLPSDLLGKKAVGTLAGFSGMAAKLGAVGLTALVPYLTADGNYAPAFIIGASLAIVAMAAVWLLIPKIEPLKKLD